MKIVEKISLAIFSYILLILAIISCVIVFGWLTPDFVNDIVKDVLNDSVGSKAVLIASIVIIIWTVLCILFAGDNKEKEKSKIGILLENQEGKLLISKETLESLISSVAKGFDGAENITSKVVLDRERNVTVFVTLFVHPDAVIKDLSSNLQTKIKEAIKTTSGLEVKEVNIRVKNIAPEKINIEE